MTTQNNQALVDLGFVSLVDLAMIFLKYNIRNVLIRILNGLIRELRDYNLDLTIQEDQKIDTAFIEKAERIKKQLQNGCKITKAEINSQGLAIEIAP